MNREFGRCGTHFAGAPLGFSTQRARVAKAGGLFKRGPKTLYITQGSPWENPYIESFHGKFRDECLNMRVFTDGRHAQNVIEHWRNEYDELRPHSSLNYMTPAEFAAHCRNSGRPIPPGRDSGNAEVPEVEQQTEAGTLTPVGT
ncbi:MAG: transposase [bacterium]|nr:transposase [bacterium]